MLSDETAGRREDLEKKNSKGKFDKFPDTNPHEMDVSRAVQVLAANSVASGFLGSGQSLNAVAQSAFEVRLI